jgi:predicted butyrate kinase (DUF1464 family)
MVKAAGIDPGTGSMDILAFDDERNTLLADISVPRSRVTQDPTIIINILEKINKEYGLDSIVAPSGYGIPLKRAQEATLEEIRLATFIHCEDERKGLQIVGLRKIMMMLRESNLPAWFTPGAVHLPTIPEYRKVGKIDLGTADKIFTVAAALASEVEKYHIEPESANIIVVEAGQAYTSVILVENGRITDAIAGTAGFPGYMGLGCWDSETAYIMATLKPGFSKSELFKGGIMFLLNIQSSTPENDDTRRLMEEAGRILAEYIVKAIGALATSASEKVERVYVSGRLFRSGKMKLYQNVKNWLAKKWPQLKLEEPLRLGVETKVGATGAALIANGLAGGKY